MSGESSFTSPTTAFGRYRHDVFLSFRGKDTRLTFTDHLYHTLKDAGIHTFRDDNELQRGQDIPSELIQDIRSSRIVVVVFSRNYGDSWGCLQEIIEIMECRRTKGQHVLPVFYRVDPSDVRNQRGSFGEAFHEHQNLFLSEKEKSDISKWRTALTEAASLSGWHITPSDQHEAEVVRDIASKVSNELKHTLLNVPKFIVGIDSRLPDMIEHMNLNKNNRVLFIGICGMGGIGKTILAKVLFNQIFRIFEGKSFLADIRENSKQPNGIVHLQEQLLSDVLKLGDIANPNIGGSDKGIHVIKQRLCSTSVLIVLDDVDDRKQIEALAGDHDWFSPGSRVIITTRNPNLLKEIKVDTIYTVEELNEDESIHLFNHHCNPREEEFHKISTSIIHYCKGLPLALEILGSLLQNRSIKQWNDELDKLKKAPPIEFQKKLKISFDALIDDNDKDVFLDIACFFVGWDKDDAVCALNGCGLSAETALSVLVNQDLVKIDWENKVTMHDLIRDMGRAIVLSECPRNPGKRSRLWSDDDILKTLQDNLGTVRVVGIMQILPGLHEVKVSAEGFAKMKQLRLLCLDNVHVYGNYGLLSSELRWLRWRRFSLKYIPNDFYMGNLISIDMQHSNLREAWRSIKLMKELKILDLSHSHSLIKTPDFSNLPSLEKLNLEDCRELKYMDETIGGLQRLCVINLKDCIKLRCIPYSICSRRLRSLRVLNISGCTSIKKLAEEDLRGLMESLSEFHADKQWLSLNNTSRSGVEDGLKTTWFKGIVSMLERLGVHFRKRVAGKSNTREDINSVEPKQKRTMDEEADSFITDAKRFRSADTR